MAPKPAEPPGPPSHTYEELRLTRAAREEFIDRVLGDLEMLADVDRFGRECQR